MKYLAFISSEHWFLLMKMFFKCFLVTFLELCKSVSGIELILKFSSQESSNLFQS